jgi:hypothetical protein
MHVPPYFLPLILISCVTLMEQVISKGSGYYGAVRLVPDGPSFCTAASYKPVLESSFLVTSTDQFIPIIGSYILIDNEYMQVLEVDTQNLFQLTVSRGQYDTEPAEHTAGSILYLKLEHAIGSGATCIWTDNVNATYAPYPYAFSTLRILLGYNAAQLTCKPSFDETGKKICLPANYGVGSSQVFAFLFLRPGTIYQRHILSYPAGMSTKSVFLDNSHV